MNNGLDAPYPTLTRLTQLSFRLSRAIMCLAVLPAIACLAASVAMAQGPAPVTNLQSADHPWDGGDNADLTWEVSADDATLVESYFIYKAMMQKGPIPADLLTESERKYALVDVVPAGTTEYTVGSVPGSGYVRLKDLSDEQRALFDPNDLPDKPHKKITVELGYLFKIVAVGSDGSQSVETITAAPYSPTRQWFDAKRMYLLIITIIFGGSVVFFIQHARAGKDLKIRKIGGLAAVDEAVGRATEMGRSCMFIPGILDMNDIQTIAGMTVLSRVAKTAAEYDAKVEVPTCRSLVMTSARETVQAAYLSAGRPDAYNADFIYYVTDEQFGYVAYLQGNMVREKPAACFYMGAFYAESLILAETGNSIGAIQIAGTAMPAQLPFFVAACDYTLIGEEFFAASAYLSGEPEQLGSLKGQDVGKIIVGIGIIVGVTIATLAAWFVDTGFLTTWSEYIKGVILT
ncbi:MAG: hypothetical protein D8M59_09010 [Planctomycetes bacterium]|nr:hypothetical protein [Planctomycetota bacterium]NOG54199.1 hypothetical protein [Planctomycetota bacterium]